jgi:hypothetical protein
MKVILNKCYGGFSVSNEAYMKYAEKSGIKLYCYGPAEKPNVYTKIDSSDMDVWYTFFKKDFGDIVRVDDVEWNEYLRLDRESRTDPILIEVVEELGEKANTNFSHLVVVDIPDGLDYVIDEYDGYETLHERVQEW